MKLEPTTRYVIEAVCGNPPTWQQYSFPGPEINEAKKEYRRVKRHFRAQFRLVRETIEREQIAPKMP